MNILIINGSYRAQGNTRVLIDMVKRGFEENDARISEIFLAEKDIRYCRGCMSCFGQKDAPIADCVVKDDVRDIFEQMLTADALVVACPIYWGTMSAPLTVLAHRMTALTYDKALDGGFKGIPMPKHMPTKPGMYITSSIAPTFLFSLSREYRCFKKRLSEILRFAGYRTSYTLIEGGSMMGMPIREREKTARKAERMGRALSSG
ncbi:MAG: flavodoxin family protein [Deltaproteobacteria bacterium]|nr:flavodoxin family protein [Candidatus Zymogenaceae bacterium]